MRLTAVLCKQHLGRMMRRHWQTQGMRRLNVNLAKQKLESLNIPVEDAVEYANWKPPGKRYEFVGYYDKPAPLDETHPLWKERVCYVARDERALLCGLQQAQLLTKTILASEELPQPIERAAEKGAPESVHALVRRAVLNANAFDADQQKLPRRVDPERPAHIFRREYGITEERANFVLSNKLLSIVERHSDENSRDRMAIMNANVVATVTNSNHIIQMRSPSSALVTSCSPLPPFVKEFDFTEGVDMPNIYPMKFTISLEKEHIYEIENIYPLCNTVQSFHPHTSYLQFNRSQTLNHHRTRVTDDQIYGRSLIHCFSIAKTYARQMNLPDCEDLPSPITVQCVQSDGREFHFSVFQLNTLKLDNREGTKNIFFLKPNVAMFDWCRYESAIPTLTGYNPKAFDYLYAMYNVK